MKRLGRPPYPDVLTPRQWQVLALLREGLSNEQIAGRLGISLDGVKFHVSEILGKLGVTSRNEAARWQPDETGSVAPSASMRHGAACREGRSSSRPRRELRVPRRSVLAAGRFGSHRRLRVAA